MANKSKKEEDLLVDVGSSLTSAERFFEENKLRITAAAVIIAAIVGGYFAYTLLYVGPQEKEAQAELYHAQQHFSNDSLQKAIQGDGQHLGFLDIAADYGATKAGNLANYYAGISYLHLSEYQNAIRLLDEFSTDDPILSVLQKGALGDAFLELGQTEQALDYYEAASEESDNDFVVPFFLKKAGLTAELAGDFEEAQEYFEEIKNEYPDSKQASDIQKYLGRVVAKNSEED